MTNLQKQVAKCIRYDFRPVFLREARSLHGRFTSFLAACLPLLFCVATHAQPVTTLTDQTPMIDVSGASNSWIDVEGKAGTDLIAAASRKALFTPSRAGQVYALGREGVLWQHYRFSKAETSQQEWVLAFPQPLLDRVTVYQSTAAGNWNSLTAGDTLAVATWPVPGRYAQFQLRLPDSGVHDVYVRIQNVTSMSVPVSASTQISQSQRLQFEYLVAGLVSGALLLLVVACIVQSRIYRDRAYGWYALYASILTLVMAAWTGVAGHLLWPNADGWNDLAPGVLGILAGGAALLVIHHLCGLGLRHRWFEHAGHLAGVASLPLALAYAVLERHIGVPMVASYLSLVVVIGLARAWTTWKRNDVIGLWTLAAFTPMAVATLLLLVNVVGFMPTTWLSRYGLMIGLIFEMPLLLIALNMRSRERHSVEARAQALVSQDALTGLLTPHIFQDRFKQIVARARRHREDAAVVYIELVNYKYIKKTWGTAVAEQSLLRSVIKLRRILRDVDTVGRVDEARFGLVLEGVSTRGPVTELAARLIAAGLMPLKGLKPEIVLQFHIAAVLLNERQGSDTEIGQALADLVQQMGPRSRRPIRFLEPEMTKPMPLMSGEETPDDAALMEPSRA
ncbi:MAG: diguanylate cyclase [Polaromonas sp.]|uniref:sensor domain-containing diguanylate cyclase n=1 Tax=Polaromonas sp. TaxID=1869339 RepID=UPI0025DBA271|nr:7TM diverse intracellular signaling domain-containing protein [Polaromonas sp.]MBI2726045.1 diguanylate cyclase [Polaromonas sp.]